MAREGEEYGGPAWEVKHWRLSRSFVYFDLEIDEFSTCQKQFCCR